MIKTHDAEVHVIDSANKGIRAYFNSGVFNSVQFLIFKSCDILIHVVQHNLATKSDR